MRKPQYLVVYRDSKKTKSRIYGPFVDTKLAHRFKDNLPTPLPGGFKVVKHTEPQTFEDVAQAASRVAEERRVSHQLV